MRGEGYEGEYFLVTTMCNGEGELLYDLLVALGIGVHIVWFSIVWHLLSNFPIHLLALTIEITIKAWIKLAH